MLLIRLKHWITKSHGPIMYYPDAGGFGCATCGKAFDFWDPDYGI